MVWEALGEQVTLWFLGTGVGRSQQVGFETQAAGRSMPP